MVRLNKSQILIITNNIAQMRLAGHRSRLHIPEHTRSLSGSLLGYKTIP